MPHRLWLAIFLSVLALPGFGAPAAPPGGPCPAPSFSPPTHFAARTRPAAVAVGDFNRDGIADLAVPNIGSGDVSVLLGTGGGAFAPAVHFPFSAEPIAVAAA